MLRGENGNSGARWFNEDFMKCPGAPELLEKWEGLLENHAFLEHVNILKQFGKGLDPIPDRNYFEHFLRASGHEFAAVNGLGDTNNLTLILAYFRMDKHNYFALHGTLAARLLDTRRAMTEQEVKILYSSMDRLLRGGLGWPNLTSVPTADKAFYSALREVTFPCLADATTPLNEVLEGRAEALLGEARKPIFAVVRGSCTLLATAAAVKRGAAKVTPNDAIEGCRAYLRLFETDIRALPLVHREGRSGYELSTHA